MKSGALAGFVSGGGVPIVSIETTAGNLVFELYPREAPKTVENFLRYVHAGFYAGTVFHRVIPNFVAQGGGYLADGSRKVPLAPPLKLEIARGLKHVDGALAMARLPEPDSATCEFYVCDGDQRELDGKYAVFGWLVEGKDTLRRILSAPRKSNDWPADPTTLLRAYEGKPDPANPTPRWNPPAADKPAVDLSDAEQVRAAARRLRGRAALLRAKRPMLAFADLEAMIAKADRTGAKADLDAAERMLAEKERR